jgi:phage-related protein
MAQLNRYSFAGYYFNQPNVKVRQVTKGSPPLRGSNFIAPGRPGEIWTPKKHGGRMLTLEILVIDEPRGTARMIFDQIQQLAATRTQSALVNYLDSGPRTAQAEIVNWTAQDIDNVGLVFVGQLDFYLADPWFYGPTVTGSVTPTSTISIGPPTTNPLSAGVRSTYTLSLSGVVSGQPIIVVHDGANSAASGITDTFAGHAYTWTRVQQLAGMDMWIGTGGSGTSGVLTVTVAPGGGDFCGGWAFPLVGASLGAGLAAVDVYGDSAGTAAVTLSLTPTAAGELAMYAAGSSVGYPIVATPAAPWASTRLLSAASSSVIGDAERYLSPPSGVALAASWASVSQPGSMFAIGAVIKTAGGAPAALAVTNPGSVTAEKITLDLLGPIINPTITNTTNGTSATVITTVSGSTHLVIDTGASTVTNAGLNVVGSLSHTGATPFLTLSPGVNNLLVYGSGCSGATLLTVSFAPPWM